MLGKTSRSTRSGQSAFEFLFLLLFVIFVASLVTVLLQQNLQREIEILDRQTIQEFRNVWYDEIQEASTVEEGYDRVFRVESNPRGFNLQTTFGADPSNVTDELLLSYKDLSTLFFLPATVDYSHLGQNVSLSDGVRISRRCYDECQVFVFDGEDIVAGVQGTEVSDANTVTNPRGLSGSWPYLVAGGSSGYDVFNTSNESDVTNIGGGSWGTNDVSFYDDLAFLAGSGTAVVNLSEDPSAIQTSFGTGTTTRFVQDYPYGYAVKDDGSLSSYWVGNLSQTVSLGSTTNPGATINDAAYDPRGYVYAAGDTAIHVYDVRDRSSPQYVGGYGGGASSVSYRDRSLYAVSGSDLTAYSPSDPTSGLGSSETVGGASGEGSQLWRKYAVVQQADGFVVVSTDDLSQGVVETVDLATTVSSLHVNHDAMFTAANGEVRVWD